MANTIICGMDAHDNTLSNRIGVNRGNPETKAVKNTQDGRQKLFNYLKALAEKHEGARIVVAYEASPIGFGIYDECVESGIECHILAPTKMPKAAKDRKRKYDERDAQFPCHCRGIIVHAQPEPMAVDYVCPRRYAPQQLPVPGRQPQPGSTVRGRARLGRPGPVRPASETQDGGI